ncbi:VOC family protein [Ferruginibacter sp.]
MITGAHSIIYSTDTKADIDFFKNVLQFPHVDVGHGWLIFALPPSEVAIHPSTENGLHELYLICDDIKAFLQLMKKHQVTCTKIDEQRWGSITYITLPGGGKLGIYQPKHVRPVNAKKTTKTKTAATKKKVAKKK